MRALAVAAVLIATASAAAQPAAYRRLVRDAVAEFEAGRWAEARALFDAAHQVEPSARTLRGIGMCEFEMGQYGAAIRTLEASLADARSPLTARQRTQVRDLVVRARSFIGRYRIVTEPPEAVLRVDDAPPVLDASGEIVLNLGEHTFEASLSGYATERRRIRVRGGEQLELTLTLSRVPPPSAPTPVVVASAVPAAAVSLLVAAGALLIAEGAAVGWLVDRQSELDYCLLPRDDVRCTNATTLADQRDAAVGTTIGVGAAVLALATAGALAWWLETASAPPRPAFFRCAPGLLGAACTGRF